MRDLLFLELKEVYAGVVWSEAEIKQIANSALLMDSLSVLARKEGLLPLEAVCACERYKTVINYKEDTYAEDMRRKYGLERIKPGSFEEHLAGLILLIVDGTEANDVYEIGLATYYSSNFTKVQKLRFLLYLYGTLQIQKATSSCVFERMLTSFLPEEACNMYLNVKEEQAKKRVQTEAEQLMERIEQACNPVKYPDKDNEIYHCFFELEDTEVQRLLREVDSYTLMLALKGMPGNVRRRFLSNLSNRLAGMILDDLETYGPITAEDTNLAAEKIFAILQKLQ